MLINGYWGLQGDTECTEGDRVTHITHYSRKHMHMVDCHKEACQARSGFIVGIRGYGPLILSEEET
jgi:hypothetical protein